VMKIDQIDLSNPIQALELAFHSDDKWYQLTKFFKCAEVDLIPQSLACCILNG
jgi:hypothetical protein